MSRVGTSNYTLQYMWDVITCPCPWYMCLVQRSSYAKPCHTGSCYNKAGLYSSWEFQHRYTCKCMLYSTKRPAFVSMFLVYYFIYIEEINLEYRWILCCRCFIYTFILLSPNLCVTDVAFYQFYFMILYIPYMHIAKKSQIKECMPNE